MRTGNSQEWAWASALADKIYEKTKRSASRSGHKIPYLTVDGIFDDWSDRIGWWTNGFYAGQLWQLYHAYGDELFRQIAQTIENKLDRCLMDYMGLDHDNGFKWLLTAAANHTLTGNPASKNRALLAAANLAGRFNIAGGFIRAWNDQTGGNAGWAIIDCMMNLPLLYWASRQTHDPRFSHIAKAHADTALRAFLRQDGSVHHIVELDVDTGAVLRTLGGQGKAVGSSWTRGQAWALYGFALSYRHAQEPAYLEAAKKVAKYFVSSLPESGIVPVDFQQEPGLDWEDSSAAAIGACGLLELEQHVPPEERAFFHEGAVALLKPLAEKRCNWDPKADYILENCTAAYHDETHNFSMIYGDYFFTEAIFKLCGKEIFLW